MSLFDNFMDLPIGILPGSVRDDPAVPVPQGDAGGETPTRAAAPPVSGRQLALQIAGDLHELVGRVGRLEQRFEAGRKNFLAVGTRTGGGNASETALQILKPNDRRRGLFIKNLDATNDLTLGLGQGSPQAGTGIVLQPGDDWDGTISGDLWIGAVTVVGNAASVAYSWLEA